MDKRCGRCGLVKPLDDFAWRRIHKKQKDNYCRPCRAAYHQEHYSKNKARYIRNAGARTKRLLKERVAWVISYLEEHPCVDCGETDVLVLDFDHLGEKSFTISTGLRYRNWQSVLAEIKKCEVVCANCHRRRTARRAGFLRALMTAGARQPIQTRLDLE